MKKQELVAAIADKIGNSQRVVDEVLKGLSEVATEELSNGGEVPITGLGKLKAVTRAPRSGRNPKTGEAVEIPAKTAVKFVPSSDLKSAL